MSQIPNLTNGASSSIPNQGGGRATGVRTIYDNTFTDESADFITIGHGNTWTDSYGLVWTLSNPTGSVPTWEVNATNGIEWSGTWTDNGQASLSTPIADLVATMDPTGPTYDPFEPIGIFVLFKGISLAANGARIGFGSYGSSVHGYQAHRGQHGGTQRRRLIALAPGTASESNDTTYSTNAHWIGSKDAGATHQLRIDTDTALVPTDITDLDTKFHGGTAEYWSEDGQLTDTALQVAGRDIFFFAQGYTAAMTGYIERMIVTRYR